MRSAAGARRARGYVGRNAGPGIPRPGYMEAVLDAARGAALPEPYLRELERLSPRVQKPDAIQPGPRAPRGREAGTVTPRRTSPLEPERDPSAGWNWDG